MSLIFWLYGIAFSAFPPRTGADCASQSAAGSSPPPGTVSSFSVKMPRNTDAALTIHGNVAIFKRRVAAASGNVETRRVRAICMLRDELLALADIVATRSLWDMI